jgi:hypothetical protein
LVLAAIAGHDPLDPAALRHLRAERPAITANWHDAGFWARHS